MKIRPTCRKGKAWKPAFLKALEECPYITSACKMAHISFAAVYKEREKNKGFAEEWEQAIKIGFEKLANNCYHLARHGSKDWQWLKGPGGRLLKKPLPPKISEGLAKFLLTAHDPGKYAPALRNEISGLDGGPIVTQAVLYLPRKNGEPDESPKVVLPRKIGRPRKT